MTPPRTARLPALAKINLDLRVLHPRPDGFHEIRTVFQTISLADTIDVRFSRARRTAIRITGADDIPDNLVARAAHLILDAMRLHGRVEFALSKRIPMGAGLGGGSSDAAAVLLALPVLAGRRLDLPRLMQLAANLGSDVPFFLLGGAAVALGRGTELYPLPDAPPRCGLLIAPGVHVSTAAAYRALAPQLTTESQQNKIVSFQSRTWGELGDGRGVHPGVNDFETVVFEQFPQLAVLKKRLVKLGASPAMMTGSGSALFGLFRTRQQINRAKESLSAERVLQISLVGRTRYRRLWWRALQPYIEDNLWPPLSRSAR
ncbi:MAG TPA: 4-(cytidine 5'-diphospho)-2-C-methyl-D-erythritol kinase [Bryobacteraceae bacterium]|nr:4-(cytidine 5'-diphospho)-2-C-methyl-D-erythritol kinase [Bryobacteraceae bacterium]